MFCSSRLTFVLDFGACTTSTRCRSTPVTVSQVSLALGVSFLVHVTPQCFDVVNGILLQEYESLPFRDLWGHGLGDMTSPGITLEHWYEHMNVDD